MTSGNTITSFVAFTVIFLCIACHANSTSLEPMFDETNYDIDREPTMDEIVSEPPPKVKPGAPAALSSQAYRKMELDILVNDEQWQTLDSIMNNHNSGGLQDTKAFYLWPNATIPYDIKSEFRDEHLYNLSTAMDTFEKYTCIKFRNAKHHDENYVEIFNGPGCSSFVGRQQKKQMMILQDTCFAYDGRAVLHELAHAIGLHHEHSRYDRDDYVTISRENINKNNIDDFQKVENAEPYIGIPYSYLSIMHYGKAAFAIRRGTDTIKAKNSKYQELMGKTKALNFEDIKLINKMYSCAAHCPEILCPGEGFVGKDCNCWCPSIHRNSSYMPCYEYAAACGGTYYVDKMTQYLRSPGFPQNYPPRISCTWTLLAKSGNGSISLQLTKVSTEECCDHVVIFDNTGGQTIISGTKSNIALTVGHRVSISFTADDYLEDAGFEIEFKAISKNLTKGTFGAASYSFKVPLSSVELAVTHQGTMIFKTLHGSLAEYLPSGRLIDCWIPLKQSMNKMEEIQDVANLQNEMVAVSLLNSQQVLLLRRSVTDSTIDGQWIENPPLLKLTSSPWRLSTFGDTLTVSERIFNETNDMMFVRQLYIVNLTTGQQQQVLRREYDIYSMALTSERVVTTSFHKVKLNNVREKYVIDAHDLHNDQIRWRHELDDFVEDLCTDLEGRTLYAAVKSSDSSGTNGRVAAFDMADGKEIQRNIFNGASILQPIALAVGQVLGLSKSALVVLSTDPTSKQFKTVTVHP